MVLSIKNLEIIDETYYCDGEPVTDFTVEFLGHLVRWETVSRIVTIKYGLLQQRNKR